MTHIVSLEWQLLYLEMMKQKMNNKSLKTALSKKVKMPILKKSKKKKIKKIFSCNEPFYFVLKINIA